MSRADSTNSSQAPSSDGPAAARREKPPRRRGRRKPGGQKGRCGRQRELEPPVRADSVVSVLLSDGRHCGRSLPQQIERVRTVGEVHRYNWRSAARLRNSG